MNSFRKDALLFPYPALNTQSGEDNGSGCAFSVDFSHFDVNEKVRFALEKGDGPHVYDINGKKYLDFVLCQGRLLFGHDNSELFDLFNKLLGLVAANESIESYINPDDLVISAVPCFEKVCFTTSEASATNAAVKLAKSYTGRAKLIVFEGTRHEILKETNDVIVLSYNDVEAFHNAINDSGKEIAACLVEPIASSMGCVPASSNFLYELRNLTRSNETVLIFDEITTGFRVDFGGAQRRFSITPDMTLLGKVLGDGVEIGAFGGKAEIFNTCNFTSASDVPAGYEKEAFCVNAFSLAAAVYTLKKIKEANPYSKLERLGAILAEGLEDAARDANIPVVIEQWGSMLSLFFLGKGHLQPQEALSEDQRVLAEAAVSISGNKVIPASGTSSSKSCLSKKINDWNSASKCNTDLYEKFAAGMLERGFYFPCNQFQPFFISSAHTESDLFAAIKAAEEVFASLYTVQRQ
ncbi:MAG: aspartate aminotransferase family protein [Thermoguttaceae bacterium]